MDEPKKKKMAESIGSMLGERWSVFANMKPEEWKEDNFLAPSGKVAVDDGYEKTRADEFRAMVKDIVVKDKIFVEED